MDDVPSESGSRVKVTFLLPDVAFDILIPAKSADRRNTSVQENFSLFPVSAKLFNKDLQVNVTKLPTDPAKLAGQNLYLMAELKTGSGGDVSVLLQTKDENRKDRRN